MVLLIFLLACLTGTAAAWRVKPARAEMLVAVLPILCCAIVAGAVTVAAEAGSAMARYLGLGAVLLGSFAFASVGMVASRIAGGWPFKPRP